jgi:phospholipase D1/2
LREKLKHTHLYNLKVKASHFKHKFGKFGNLFNPNHRHDEEHEKITDDKRTKIAESHRFESFAPIRENNDVKWYVDGRDFFWAVSVALDRAKESIYIEDWWLSPELFLRRPPYFNQEWRLDQVLKRKAQEGVKIYVIVYKEVEAALTCNSLHTKHALEDLVSHGHEGHKNIKVMRHPDHNVLENAGDMTFYWAHHEKFLVIDYQTAFIGGLDLCYGRWDTHQHSMSDIHPSGIENEVWPGQDYNNNRIMDFHSVEDWNQNQLSKAEYGRMPWHDVGMGLIGEAVYDIAEHFVLRWNFCKRDKYKRSGDYPWLTLEGKEGEDEDLVGVQRPKFPEGGYVHHPFTRLGSKHLSNRGSLTCQILRSSCDWSSGILVEHSIMNAYCEIIRNAEHYVYIENQFFITATGEEQAPIQNVIGSAIVDAVVRAAKENRKFRIIAVIPAIPGFAGDLRDDAAIGTRAIMDYQYKSILRGEHSIYERIKAQGVDPTKYIFFFNLRSYDRLNTTPGIKAQEKKSGISYKDYQNKQAQEIMATDTQKDNEGSKTADDSGDLEEEKEVDERRRFEDQKDSVGLGADEKTTGQERKTASSIAHCAMLGPSVVSNETWVDDAEDLERMNIVQEELYIHAKVMIADDKIAICGSANINDRSQIGIHDSELAVCVEDTKVLNSKMDGQAYEAGHFVATLRRQLWREHLGLLPPQDLDASSDPNAQPPGDGPNVISEGEEDQFVADPLDDKLWETWTGNATTNTDIFREIFHADPDDIST